MEGAGDVAGALVLGFIGSLDLVPLPYAFAPWADSAQTFTATGRRADEASPCASIRIP